MMVYRATKVLNISDFTALYDKGYHTSYELKLAIDLGVKLLVAIPASGSGAPDSRYNLQNFKYDKVNNYYICPENQILKPVGKWHEKDRANTVVLVHSYRTSSCKSCPVRALCTKSSKGRVIDRSQYAAYVEENRKNIEAGKAIYKQRQAIVEHPYGTIKRQWGYSYIITKKGIKRASADVGLMFIAYNLRRIMNTVDKKVLFEGLKAFTFLLFRKTSFLKAISFDISTAILSIDHNSIELKPLITA
jgi:hypothetical protein